MSRAVEALLTELIDYAGLFPPAALTMPDAVRAYARYRRSGESWALGRFVVPAARLGEFSEAFRALPEGECAAAGIWRLSALAGATDAAALDAFDAEHVGCAMIDTVEGKAASVAEIEALRPLLGAGRQVYVEIPLTADLDALITAIGAAGMRAKMRTGGVTADGFPTARAVARFLDACARAAVPSKATAGLHHPLRGEYRLTYAPDSPSGTMFGFLNVVCAAMLIGHGLPMDEAIALLEERDVSAFRVTDAGIHWRDRFVPLDGIRAARAASTASFGSCSFEEPIHDLKGLSLL